MCICKAEGKADLESSQQGTNPTKMHRARHMRRGGAPELNRFEMSCMCRRKDAYTFTVSYIPFICHSPALQEWSHGRVPGHSQIHGVPISGPEICEASVNGASSKHHVVKNASDRAKA
jgi:hypothetical protein